jgi:hypothetical protein
MTMPQATVQNAARLVYKALNTNLSPANDTLYRELLDVYRADPKFAADVQDIATGLELIILDFSERGLVVVPTSRESRFAVRIADIRTNLKQDQKAGLVLAHVAIASVFFPTTDGLEDDNYFPPPASVAQFRDALHALSRRLKDAGGNLPGDIPLELAPGWELICAMPSTVPSSQRAAATSVTGLIGLALTHMVSGGLARLDRDSAEEALATYTATHRLRVQLRELTLRRLFELAQSTHIATQASI